MAVYTRQIELAIRLIKARGQAVVWRRLSNIKGDSDKPWKPTNTGYADVPVSIVFLPATRENRELLRHLTGSEVAGGSLYGLMHAVSFAPSLRDAVIRDGVELKPYSIDPLSPNGEIILYTIQFDASGKGEPPNPDDVFDVLSDTVNNLPGEIP